MSSVYDYNDDGDDIPLENEVYGVFATVAPSPSITPTTPVIFTAMGAIQRVTFGATMSFVVVLFLCAVVFAMIEYVNRYSAGKSSRRQVHSLLRQAAASLGANVAAETAFYTRKMTALDGFWRPLSRACALIESEPALGRQCLPQVKQLRDQYYKMCTDICSLDFSQQLEIFRQHMNSASDSPNGDSNVIQPPAATSAVFELLDSAWRAAGIPRDMPDLRDYLKVANAISQCTTRCLKTLGDANDDISNVRDALHGRIKGIRDQFKAFETGVAVTQDVNHLGQHAIDVLFPLAFIDRHPNGDIRQWQKVVTMLYRVHERQAAEFQRPLLLGDSNPTMQLLSDATQPSRQLLLPDRIQALSPRVVPPVVPAEVLSEGADALPAQESNVGFVAQGHESPATMIAWREPMVLPQTSSAESLQLSVLTRSLDQLVFCAAHQLGAQLSTRDAIIRHGADLKGHIQQLIDGVEKMGNETAQSIVDSSQHIASCIREVEARALAEDAAVRLQAEKVAKRAQDNAQPSMILSKLFFVFVSCLGVQFASIILAYLHSVFPLACPAECSTPSTWNVWRIAHLPDIFCCRQVWYSVAKLVGLIIVAGWSSKLHSSMPRIVVATVILMGIRVELKKMLFRFVAASSFILLCHLVCYVVWSLWSEQVSAGNLYEYFHKKLSGGYDANELDEGADPTRLPRNHAKDLFLHVVWPALVYGLAVCAAIIVVHGASSESLEDAFDTVVEGFGLLQGIISNFVRSYLADAP